MLEAINLSHQTTRHGAEPLVLLDGIHFLAPGGHFLAIVGSAGSGKTTLLQTLGGLSRVQSGAILWHGRDIAQNWLLPNELGWVTTDESVMQPLMSAKENLVCALLLAVGGITQRDALLRAEKLLTLCGLEQAGAQRVATLSRVQRRRLALALALAADPPLILIDEFTDGLDPKGEQEMLTLLQLVAKSSPHHLVIHATSDLSHLPSYDSVVVLHEGRVCFHGPGRALTHYFSIANTDELYVRLAKRPSQRWMDSWNKHRDSYYDAFKLATGGTAADGKLAAADEEDKPVAGRLSFREPKAAAVVERPAPPAPAERPTFGTQVQVLMLRRWTLFRRAKTQLWRYMGLLLGLPLIALVFFWPALDEMRALHKDASAVPPATQTYLAAFASGFLMLQVLMVLIMAVRNGANEIANERTLWNREHRAGLRSSAYVTSKLCFVLPLILMQSAWLGLFVDMTTGGLPGHSGSRLLLLMLTSAAFTTLSLGMSALSRNPDRASARAWILAFAQVPLSGALLAMPSGMTTLVQPLVTAFYAWSGSLSTLTGTPLSAPITMLNPTWLATPGIAIFMLLAHFFVGLGLTIYGVRRSR